MLLLLRGVHAQTHLYVADLFLYEEFPGPDVTKIYKTFFDVATWEEFWQYIQNPFLEGLFSPPDVGLGTGYIYGTYAPNCATPLALLECERCGTPVLTARCAFTRRL